MLPGQPFDVDDFVPAYEQDFTTDHAEFMEKNYERPKR